MSNPVVDNKLTDWQPDALGSDSNLPIATTPMGTGSSGELAGELRLIKSVVRGVTIAMSWERWLGILSGTTFTDIAFTFVDGTHFTVNDNFTVGSGLGVAQLGRRVIATLVGGQIVGTITAATFSPPNTIITVTWDSGALDNTLTEVQFGLRTDAAPPTNISAVTLNGDVTGPSSANVVGKLQTIPVSATVPTTGQQLTFDGTQWIGELPASTGTTLKNNTGLTLAAGDVVSVDPTLNDSVALVDTLATQKQLLVSTQSVANGVNGLFVNEGIGLVNVTGAVTRGHYLLKSATSRLAQDSGVAQDNTQGIPNGAFCVALESAVGPGAAQIYALFLGATFSAASVTPQGDTFVMFDGGVNKVSRTTDTGFANVSISPSIGTNIAKIAILQVTLTLAAIASDINLDAGASCLARFRKGGSAQTTSLSRVQTQGFSRGVSNAKGQFSSAATDTIFVPVDSSFIFQYDLTTTISGDPDTVATVNLAVDLVGYVY